jgi:hypothetical protein
MTGPLRDRRWKIGSEDRLNDPTGNSWREKIGCVVAGGVGMLKGQKVRPLSIEQKYIQRWDQRNSGDKESPKEPERCGYNRKSKFNFDRVVHSVSIVAFNEL